jgi:hypothetical protein
MKRSWTALAVALMAIFAAVGCNDYGNTFQNNTGAVLSFLSPPQISACVPAPTPAPPCPGFSADNTGFTLTVNGSGFVLKTVVRWNGQPLATTVPVDSTGAALGNVVTATVPAALVAKPGVATIITLNPASGAGLNGLSNPIAFTINPPPNPPPVLASITPQTKPAGNPDFTLTLNGSNFLPASDPSGGSQVKWSGTQQRQLTIVGTTTASQITATVTSDLLANSSTSSVTASVTVSNPPSPPPAGCITSCTGGGGGGPSAPLTFTICASGQSSCAPAAAAKAGATAMVAEETPALSLDGRFVAYTAIQNDRAQILLRDTCEGAASGCRPHTTLLSAAADGTPANDDSRMPSMSADGRYVAFSSAATNLAENAPPGRQIYLLDTCAGAGDSCKPSTHLISTDPNGALVGTESVLPSVSSSGRFVAFLAVTPSHSSKAAEAQSKTSVSGNNSGYRQVFIRDTCLGSSNCTPKTTRISLQPGDGTVSTAKLAGPVLSGNAGHVAIAGANTATLFTRSVAVDDRVFVAIANQQH